MKITALLDALNSALAEPFALAWSRDSPRFLLVFTVIYAVVVIVAVTDQKNTRPGAEHGSAAWGDVFHLNKFYMDKRGPNLLLTQHFYIGIDGYKHKHNTNILIVGGSGAGKTRTYGVPNVLECACSMIITDPKAEILRKTGNLLKQKGYEVIVFDLINPAASFCYNPFVYVHDDREVLTLIENLIQNTTPPHAQSSDPFWTKSETALLQALMLYLLHEAPPEEQNFSMVMEMIAAAEVHEDDDNYQSPLDILFERLEMREPDSIACKQYRIFKQAAGVVCSKRLLNQAVGKSLRTHNLKPKKGAQVMRKNWPDWLKPGSLRICFLRTWWVSSIMTTAGRLRRSSTRWTDWGMVWNGNVLTAKISASPNQETACTLSDILMSDVEEKYFLSPKQQEVLLFKPTAVTKENASTPQKD